MTKKIVFTKTIDVSDEYAPKPSSVFLPEWYKKTSSYIGSNERTLTYTKETNATIKKCIPVFDVLTAGYIIPTYMDILVKRDENGEPVYLSGNQIGLEFHAISQSPYHPSMNGYAYPKWANPWSIQTPDGYSSLFIPPAHGGNKYFTILEGFVDTDKYISNINFPFVLNDPNFEGMIPAGTPMVQVIPVKRDSWQMQSGNEKNTEKIKENTIHLTSKIFDRYKSLFWNKKEYR
jgi:hypothetical protein